MPVIFGWCFSHAEQNTLTPFFPLLRWSRLYCGPSNCHPPVTITSFQVRLRWRVILPLNDTHFYHRLDKVWLANLTKTYPEKSKLCLCFEGWFKSRANLYMPISDVHLLCHLWCVLQLKMFYARVGGWINMKRELFILIFMQFGPMKATAMPKHVVFNMFFWVMK